MVTLVADKKNHGVIELSRGWLPIALLISKYSFNFYFIPGKRGTQIKYFCFLFVLNLDFSISFVWLYPGVSHSRISLPKLHFKKSTLKLNLIYK